MSVVNSIFIPWLLPGLQGKNRTTCFVKTVGFLFTFILRYEQKLRNFPYWSWMIFFPSSSLSAVLGTLKLVLGNEAIYLSANGVTLCIFSYKIELKINLLIPGQKNVSKERATNFRKILPVNMNCLSE